MDITLRAPGTPIDALALEPGLHGFGRGPGGGACRAEDAGDARIWIRVDRCGTWLSVAEGVRGVHVNGRPVRRCALLRAGDSVHVDGSELLLTGSVGAVAAAARDGCGRGHEAGAEAADACLLLRCVGGRHHGRGFPLAQPLGFGSAPDADVCLDASGCGDRDGHGEAGLRRRARIGREGGQLVLRVAADAAPVAVNGVACREAALRPGDQLAFESGQRFVVEAPMPAVDDSADAGAGDAPDAGIDAAAAEPLPATRRIPWLLLAALLLAAALSALLLL